MQPKVMHFICSEFIIREKYIIMCVLCVLLLRKMHVYVHTAETKYRNQFDKDKNRGGSFERNFNWKTGQARRI